jgi:hypothetical protein
VQALGNTGASAMPLARAPQRIYIKINLINNKKRFCKIPLPNATKVKEAVRKVISGSFFVCLLY